MLLINGKALNDLTEEEMREWCEQLRTKREALRNEAIKKKREAEEKGNIATVPKAPRVPKKTEAKDLQADILKMMVEDDD